MSKWSGEKSALKLDIFSFFFWKHLNLQRKNAIKERHIGEYGEVSRQFNV